MNQNLHFLDPSRWFIGQNPAWFLIEVVPRTIILYVVLQFALRKMGRRMASQMTSSELAVVLTLGAAIGVPIQVPQNGLLAGILILGIAWVFQRGLGFWTHRSRRFEIAAIGQVFTVVEDGRLLMDVMRKLIVSRERLFSILRAAGVEHLGQVRRVYAEATGSFSIFQFEKEMPGLSILPVSDAAIYEFIKPGDNVYVCSVCGASTELREKPVEPCVHCHGTEWVPGVVAVMEGA